MCIAVKAVKNFIIAVGWNYACLSGDGHGRCSLTQPNAWLHPTHVHVCVRRLTIFCSLSAALVAQCGERSNSSEKQRESVVDRTLAICEPKREVVTATADGRTVNPLKPSAKWLHLKASSAILV